MTAQPSSQAEREDVAREVLAEVGIEVGFGGTMMWRGNVVTGTAIIAAMLAFSDREHAPEIALTHPEVYDLANATPRSMPEEVVEVRTALVEYAMRYGPRCRECADHGDTCPMSGMACGERRKATEFVVDALIYGAAHGHCPSALIPGASA